MKNLRKEAPGVVAAFYDMTKAIDEKSPIDSKTKELILIGIFAADRALRGIGTHVRRALEAGATKDEIVSAIIYALPVVGISNVTLSLEKALEVIRENRNVDASA